MLSVLVEAAFGRPAAVARPWGIVAMTVPLAVMPLTATLYVEPLPVTTAVIATAFPERLTTSPVAKSADRFAEDDGEVDG